MEKTYDLAIAGGGPSGMAAAVQAREEGVEEDHSPRAELPSGRDSSSVYSRRIRSGGIRPYDDRTGIRSGMDKRVEEAESNIIRIPQFSMRRRFPAGRRRRRDLPETAPAGYRLKISSPSCGVESVFCRALVLASGCRERTRGQLRIPGGRPAGSIPPALFNI